MKLPQVSLRDLFWLVLVVGVGCAWWLDRTQLIESHQRHIEMISPSLPPSYQTPQATP